MYKLCNSYLYNMDTKTCTLSAATLSDSQFTARNAPRHSSGQRLPASGQCEAGCFGRTRCCCCPHAAENLGPPHKRALTSGHGQPNRTCTDVLPQLVVLEERAIYRGGCDDGPGGVRFNVDNKKFGFDKTVKCSPLPSSVEASATKCFEVRAGAAAAVRGIQQWGAQGLTRQDAHPTPRSD